MPRTTVNLQKWAPKLYAARDATGDWGRILGLLEHVLNDLLSSQDTRASLDCGTLAGHNLDVVVEASTEGAAGTLVQVALVGDSGAGVGVTVARSGSVVTIHYESVVSTVGDIEDAIAAVSDAERRIRVKTSGTAVSVLTSPGDDFAATALVGASPAGYVLGKISIDAMTDVRDPLRAELRLLQYLAQHFGWDLDTSLPEALQRKVLTLAEALFREKGTKPGIVDALRLLLGLEVVYEAGWADGWVLDRSHLDDDTILAPAATADGYAGGMLIGCAPGDLADHDELICTAWEFPFEFQRTQPAGGGFAFGYLTAVPKEQLANNLTLVLGKPGGTPVTFELQVDNGYAAQPGRVTIDLRATTDATEVATAVKDAIAAQTTLTNLSLGTNTPDHQYVLLFEHHGGVTGNIEIGGTAAAVFEAYGMRGGGVASTYDPGVNVPINLNGAVTADDVASLVRYSLAVDCPSLVVTKALAKVYLRHATKGAAGDGAITGAGATALQATGMSGGVGINPSVLTFRLIFPRHLTDQELRTASAVVDAMKRAETHWVYVNPEADPLPLWRLDKTRLDASRLLGARSGSYVPMTGSYADDPFEAKCLETWLVPIRTSSSRSAPLPIGGRFVLVADVDCYVRQGPRNVTANDTSCAFLAAGEEFAITPTSTGNAFVAALGAMPAVGSPQLRITRADGAVN